MRIKAIKAGEILVKMNGKEKKILIEKEYNWKKEKEKSF